MDKFTINPEFLTDVIVSYTCPPTESGMTGTTSSIDHPAFAAMRRHMASTGYIEIWEEGCNKDNVLKPFMLNDRKYEIGDRFTCAANQGVIETIARKQTNL